MCVGVLRMFRCVVVLLTTEEKGIRGLERKPQRADRLDRRHGDVRCLHDQSTTSGLHGVRCHLALTGVDGENIRFSCTVAQNLPWVGTWMRKSLHSSDVLMPIQGENRRCLNSTFAMLLPMLRKSRETLAGLWKTKTWISSYKQHLLCGLFINKAVFPLCSVSQQRQKSRRGFDHG